MAIRGTWRYTYCPGQKKKKRLAANLKALPSNCGGSPTLDEPLCYTLEVEGGAQEQIAWDLRRVRQG